MNGIVHGKSLAAVALALMLLIGASCSSQGEDAKADDTTEEDGATSSDDKDKKDADGETSIQQSKLDEILERGTLRVGMTGDYQPFSYEKDGELVGVDVDMAQALADSLGVELEIVTTEWGVLLDDLADDKYDIGMTGITIKMERAQTKLFSLPSIESGKVAITRDENVAKFQTIEDINKPGVKVIFNDGGTNEDFARENFPDAELIENPDNITVFDKIIDGEADVMVTDGVEAIIKETVHPELEAVNDEDPFNFFELGYMMNRDHTWKAYVDQFVNLQKRNGNYQEIFDTNVETIAADAA